MEYIAGYTSLASFAKVGGVQFIRYVFSQKLEIENEAIFNMVL